MVKISETNISNLEISLFIVPDILDYKTNLNLSRMLVTGDIPEQTLDMIGSDKAEYNRINECLREASQFLAQYFIEITHGLRNNPEPNIYRSEMLRLADQAKYNILKKLDSPVLY